jgi:O-antigen/teichoic acid export membrane protein
MRTDEAFTTSDRLRSRPPTRNLTRRASLNTIAAALDSGARFLVELIVNPLLVAGLGTYLYGAWRVLWQWSGYVWATSGRSAQALQYAIANRQRSPDLEEKQRLVAASIVVWFLFLPILVSVGGLGVWYAPHFLHTPQQYVAEVRWAAALLVADSIAVTLLTVPRSVLQGENLGYRRMGLSAVLVLVGGALIALALYLGTGIAGVAAANLVNTVLTGALFWWVARRYVPWFGMAKPTRATVRWFLGLSSWFLGWKFVFQLMTASDVLVLAGFGSVGLVAVYTLTKFVPEALSMLMLVIVQGVTPGMGGIIGSGDRGRASRVRAEVMSLTWWVVTAAGTTIVLWNGSFVDLWVGSQYDAGATATLLMVIMVGQFILIRNDTYVIDLTLDLRGKVLVGAGSTAVSITLAAVFVGELDLGISGLCAGIIGGRVILNLVYPWLIGRAIGHPLLTQLRGAVRPAATTAALFAAALVLEAHLGTPSWIGLVLAGGATATIGAVLAGLIGLSRTQRAVLFVRMRQVVGRTS